MKSNHWFDALGEKEALVIQHMPNDIIRCYYSTSCSLDIYLTKNLAWWQRNYYNFRLFLDGLYFCISVTIGINILNAFFFFLLEKEKLSLAHFSLSNTSGQCSTKRACEKMTPNFQIGCFHFIFKLPDKSFLQKKRYQ